VSREVTGGSVKARASVQESEEGLRVDAPILTVQVEVTEWRAFFEGNAVIVGDHGLECVYVVTSYLNLPHQHVGLLLAFPSSTIKVVSRLFDEADAVNASVAEVGSSLLQDLGSTVASAEVLGFLVVSIGEESEDSVGAETVSEHLGFKVTLTVSHECDEFVNGVSVAVHNTHWFQIPLGADVVGEGSGSHVLLTVRTVAVFASDEGGGDELLGEDYTVGGEADDVVRFELLAVLGHEIITRHAESLTVAVVAGISLLIFVGDDSWRHTLRKSVGQLVPESEHANGDTLDLVLAGLHGSEELEVRIGFLHGDVHDVLGNLLWL